MPLPTETIILQPYRMKDNPDHIVAAVMIKNYEDMGYLSYDRTYDVYSYSELIRLSKSTEGPITGETLNQAYEGSQRVVDVTLPFKQEPSLPPIRIITSQFYTYEIEVATEKKVDPTWTFA